MDIHEINSCFLLESVLLVRIICMVTAGIIVPTSLLIIGTEDNVPHKWIWIFILLFAFVMSMTIEMFLPCQHSVDQLIMRQCQ